MSYKLIPVRKEDWEKIRVWRNAQLDILRQDHEISKEEQQSYVRKYNRQRKKDKPDTILYSFLRGRDLVGYGGFVHTNKHGDVSAEISFLLNPRHKADLLSYTICWLMFLKLLRKESKKHNICYWRSETFLRVNDPTRKIHVYILYSLFNAATEIKDGIAYQGVKV